MRVIRLSTLAVLCLITGIVLAGKFHVRLSKNQLKVNQPDSIKYTFYLPEKAATTIHLVNVFGGEILEVEKNMERKRGWQELKLYSDSINVANYSSGVYYLDIEAEIDGETQSYNSFMKPWGEQIDLTSGTYQKQSKTVQYKVPKFSMVRVRIGLDDGILFRTLQNWTPQNDGEFNLFWDGYDQSGTFYTDVSNPRLTLEGFGLPGTVFYLDNPEIPQPKTDPITLPDGHEIYCLSDMALTAWYNPGDIAFDVEVTGNSDDLELLVNIPETDKNQADLVPIYSASNELYISLNNQFLTETQDADPSGQFTIAVPELPKGKHVVMFNYIFASGAFAIGVKEFNAE